MKILVTGGAGFIGSHVAEFYAEKRNEVVAFDNLSRAQLLGRENTNVAYNWNYLKKNTNARLVNGDVRNLQELVPLSRDADVTIHTAAQTGVTSSLVNPETDFAVNAQGTFNVLEAARRSNRSPTVVFCSTNKVYGENVNKLAIKKKGTRYQFADAKFENGIPEDFPIDLCRHTPYGCSKSAGDLYVQDYAHTYGLKTGVFRMSCIYGERQFGVEDQGWISWFVIATLTNRALTIYGDGKQVRDILYVADLIRAFNAFVESPLKQEVFNMGGGNENTLSLLELLNLLYQLTEKETRVSFADWRPGDQKVYISNIAKAKNKLRWKPKVDPKKGVEKLVRWVSENRKLFK